MDNGYGAKSFIDRKLAREIRLLTFKTARRIPVLLADGVIRNWVTEYVEITARTGLYHYERIMILLLDIENPVIFGLPWL